MSKINKEATGWYPMALPGLVDGGYTYEAVDASGSWEAATRDLDESITWVVDTDDASDDLDPDSVTISVGLLAALLDRVRTCTCDAQSDTHE